MMMVSTFRMRARGVSFEFTEAYAGAIEITPFYFNKVLILIDLMFIASANARKM